jgi:hypothetical protein
MRRTLQEIRAVQGVSGVVAVDRQINLAFHVTPAHFERNELIELSQQALRVVREAPARAVRFYFRYDNGQVLVYALQRAVVIVLGKGHLNLQLLGLVTRATFPTIERKLSAAVDKEMPSPLTLVTIEQGQLAMCVEAFNTVARRLVSEAGDYVVQQSLRRSKDLLLPRFPGLRSFAVGDDGEVALIRGREMEVPGHMIRAMAYWLDAAITGCRAYVQDMPEIDVRRLTEPASEVLSQVGFYAYYGSLFTESERLST